MSSLMHILEFNHASILNPFSIFLFSLFIFVLRKFYAHPFNNKNNQPPSPSKLPIIGNLHQLGSHPHHSLRSLATRHGPLMKLYLGSAPAYVVSSADIATEMLKTHDIDFSNRKDSKIYRRLLYDAKDLLLVPYCEYWRHMRGICVLQLLSAKRVQSFQSVRQEEIDVMMDKIKQAGKVDLSDLFGALTNDIVCRVAFGRKYSEGEGGKKFKKLFEEFGDLLGVFNIGEYVPWLDWINHVNGLYARVDKNFKELDNLLDDIIDDHVNSPNGDGVREHHVDLLEILLDIENANSNNGIKIAKDNIKAIIADMFAGGSDTTFAALEWAMTEIIRHPEVINKVQKEIRGIIGNKQEITRDDLDKMNYLKAIIKETLRLHPPIPLIPRISTKDVELHGYTVPANTRVFMNAMAIGRDPDLWKDAEEFRPERFLGNNSIDFRGQELQLIPFGGGRRGCPGVTFATAVIEIVLANLLHNFNWSLPDGATEEDLDVNETSGLSVHKKSPLVVVASPHYY